VFLRKLTVLLVPLGMLLVMCLLAPLFYSMTPYLGSLLQGALLGVLLALLLPLAGATKMREPFAWLLWIPAALILAVLLYHRMLMDMWCCRQQVMCRYSKQRLLRRMGLTAHHLTMPMDIRP
jgi:hypothetical protein